MKNVRSKRSAGEIREMIALYQANNSLASVGLIYDISRERVRQLFEEAGVARRKQTVNRKLVRANKFDAPEAELRDLYWKQDKNLMQIAEIYQVSTNVIWERFKHYGIPLRTRSEITALVPPKFPELTKSNLTQLYITEQKSAQEIADLIGCAKVTVFKKLQKFGIRKLRRRRSKK